MEPLCLEPSKALIISSADTRTFLRAGFLNSHLDPELSTSAHWSKINGIQKFHYQWGAWYLKKLSVRTSILLNEPSSLVSTCTLRSMQPIVSTRVWSRFILPFFLICFVLFSYSTWGLPIISNWYLLYICFAPHCDLHFQSPFCLFCLVSIVNLVAVSLASVTSGILVSYLLCLCFIKS